MLLFGAAAVILASEGMRTLIELVFAELSVLFQLHCKEIIAAIMASSLLCLLSPHLTILQPKLKKIFPFLMPFWCMVSVGLVQANTAKSDAHVRDDTRHEAWKLFFPVAVVSTTFLALVSLFVVIKKSDMKMPGPRQYPLVGNLFDFLFPGAPVTGSTVVDVFSKHRQQFGPIFSMRISPFFPLVVVGDPEQIKLIETKNAKSFVKFKQGYSALKPLLGGGLVTLEGALWRTHRSLVSPAFHFQQIREVAFNLFVTSTDRLMARWESRLNSETEFDVAHDFRVVTLEIIADACLSLDSSSQEHGQRLQELYNNVMSECELRFWYPYRAWLPGQNGNTFKQQLQDLDTLVMDIIVTRRKEMQSGSQVTRNRKDLLDLLLAAKEADGSTLSDEDILAEMKTFLTAGHETSSMWMAFFLHLISQPENADVQERIRQECLSITGGTIRPITYDDLGGLNYTTNALKEALRLIPPVPIVARETIDAVDIGGYRVPAGVMVVLDIWGAHHDTTIWGEDAQKFRPERFEDETSRHPYSFAPFMQGPRNCIGQNFAMLEAKVVMAMVFSRFKFSTKRPGPLKLNHLDIPLCPVDGVKLVVEKV